MAQGGPLTLGTAFPYARHVGGLPYDSYKTPSHAVHVL